MFVKSIVLCSILLYKVLYINAKIKSVNDTNPLIEIAEVNSTDININNLFLWNAGTEHTIECSIFNSTEEEHIKCLDPSKNLVEGDQKGHIVIQPYSTEVSKGQLVIALRLSFNPTNTEDSGIWQCQSADGSLNQTFSICVREKILLIGKTKYYYFASRGRSISLKCPAFGEAAPLFHWYRNEELITDDHNAKYKISYKYTTKYLISTLTITNIEKEDRGLYECKATQQNPIDINCNYTDTVNLTVKVKYAPTFKNGNSKAELYSIPGESEQIKCEADGYPKPKYTWYRHINGSNILELVDNTADLNLTIDESSFGEIYTCRAANFEGDATKTYVVTKMLKPRGPDDISFISNVGTVKSLTLNWRDEIKYPIQGVEIEYLNAECNINRLVIWESANIINLKVNEEQYNYNNSLSVTLSCLNEDSICCIRLRVTNKAGNSSWSNLITAYNTNSLGISKSSKLNVDYKHIFYILSEIFRNFPASCYGFIMFIMGYFNY